MERLQKFSKKYFYYVYGTILPYSVYPAVNGVKGTSWLMELSYYDIKGTVYALQVTKLLCPSGLAQGTNPLKFT